MTDLVEDLGVFFSGDESDCQTLRPKPTRTTHAVQIPSEQGCTEPGRVSKRSRSLLCSSLFGCFEQGRLQIVSILRVLSLSGQSGLNMRPDLLEYGRVSDRVVQTQTTQNNTFHIPLVSKFPVSEFLPSCAKALGCEPLAHQTAEQAKQTGR